jgi:hypothetical protein
LNPQADNQTFILTIPHCLLFFNDFHGYGCAKWRFTMFFLNFIEASNEKEARKQ